MTAKKKPITKRIVAKKKATGKQVVANKKAVTKKVVAKKRGSTKKVVAKKKPTAKKVLSVGGLAVKTKKIVKKNNITLKKNRVILFLNRKGGVGKSMLTSCTASILSQKYEVPTLAMDFDPQSSLLSIMGGDFDYDSEGNEVKGTPYLIGKGLNDDPDIQQLNDNLYGISCNELLMDEICENKAFDPDRFNDFMNNLQGMSCVIDASNKDEELVRMLLHVATHVIVPCVPDSESVRRTTSTLDYISEINKSDKLGLKVLMVLNRLDETSPRQKIYRDNIDSVFSKFKTFIIHKADVIEGSRDDKVLLYERARSGDRSVLEIDTLLQEVYK